MMRLAASLMVAVCVLPLSLSGQETKRVTVLPFRDRTGSNQKMNISVKVADALMAKLAETGRFTVIERENIPELQQEKSLKYDADFDPTSAPKSGLLQVCDIVITGQIDEFTANQSSTDKNYGVGSKTQVSGSTSLKITARVTAVATGQVLGGPSASVEKSGVLATSNKATFGGLNVGGGNKTADVNAALQKLVDADIDVVTDELAKKIAAGRAASVPSAAPPPVLPKFVGMEDGLAVINKGATAGVKLGERFDVVRPVPSGLVDPDTNQPIIHRKKLCVLVISSLEETTASGKCEGGVPQKGDEIRAVTP